MNVQNTANYLKMKAMNTIASSKAATSGEKMVTVGLANLTFNKFK